MLQNYRNCQILIGLWLLAPHLLPEMFNPKDASLGEFGIFAVASFCVGHIVQAPANVITDLGWRIFGRPTEKCAGLHAAYPMRPWRGFRGQLNPRCG